MISTTQQIPALPPLEPARNAVHALLIQVGVSLHRFGTPSHRLERLMTELSQIVGVQGVFLYTPTSLILSITDHEGERTYLRRVDSGSVDADKLTRFDEILERLERREISIEQASEQFDEVVNAPPPYSLWVTTLASSVACGMIAVFFRGTGVEVAAATLIGLLVALLEIVFSRLRGERGFLEPLAGAIASLSALAIANWMIPIDDRLVTLAALIVMIPGLGITVALTELAVGHLSAGVARLAGACVSLMTMTVGVALGWRVAGTWRHIPEIPAVPLPEYYQWIALAVSPIVFSIVFRVRIIQWPTIAVVMVGGFLASNFAGAQWGVEMGAFAGALVVGMGSNLYARLRDRPALVPFTPSIIVLVPGSLGYRSLTAFVDHDATAGIDFAFTMLIVAISLVGGILTANALLPPKRIL